MSAMEPGQIAPESRKTPFYPALDGLRTIAVALVFLVHYAPALFPFGWMGVQIFFVLSGFLITGILFDTARDPGRYKNFYIRRALRIFPLYYLVLGVLGMVVLLTHGFHPPYFWLWAVYLQNFFWLVTHGNAEDTLYTGAHHGFAVIGHLWSLAIEEQFYLIWPPIVFAVRHRTRLMLVCAALILSRILLAVYWQNHLAPETLQLGVIYRMLPTQCDSFLLGGLLALWLRGRPAPRLLATSGALAAAALILYATLLAILCGYPQLIHGQDAFSYLGSFQVLLGIPLCNLTAACLVLAVVQPGTWLYRLCDLAPMRSLGRVSYGLYFFHLPMYIAIGGFVNRNMDRLGIQGFHPMAHAILTTALTVPLAYLSFHWFEKPFLRLKNRFTSTQAAKA